MAVLPIGADTSTGALPAKVQEWLVEKIQDVVGTMTSGVGTVSVVYDDTAGTLTITGTGTGGGGGSSYTDEQARDAIGAALQAAVGSGVTVTVDDPGDKITIGISGLTIAQVTGLQAALNDKLPLTGGTLTGPLTLAGDPTAALHAATRQYVLAKIGELTAGTPAELDTFIETYNRFLADESALSALTTAVGQKATQSDLTAEVTRATAAEQANAGGIAGRIPALPPLTATTAATALTAGFTQPVDATTAAAAVTMTALPALSTLTVGDAYGLHKTDTGNNPVSVAFAAGDATITGATSVTLTMPGKLTLRVVAAPTGGGKLWEVVNHVRSDVILDARYAFTRGDYIVNAKKNSIATMVGDGVTNDQPAFKALVDALGAAYAADGIPRLLYVPAGRYAIKNKGTIWKSGVSLIGEGAGLTKFLQSNPGDTTNPTPLATYTTAQGASTSTPLVDCTFRDFEIDGSGVNLPGGYNTGAKGLVLQYMVRARFERLYIHDTAASGLGCDFLQDSIIDGVVATGCGRLNDGTQPGGAGIGIGVGGWGLLERTTIANCTAVNNGTHGIFVELQNNAWIRPRGIRIVGCTAVGNRWGISDWGADALVVTGCTMQNNLQHGFHVAGSGVGQAAGTGGLLVGCLMDGNALDGANLADACHRYTARGNRASNNGRYGIRHGNLYQGAAVSTLELALTDNDVFGNALDGVRFDSPLSDAFVLSNRLRNNGQQSAAAASSSGGTVTYDALTITDTGATWTVNSQFGKTVTVGSATAIVASNTATVLTLFPYRPGAATAWSAGTPAAGTAYSLPAAPTTRAGLCINNTCAHPNIRDNRLWDNQTTKTQTHGWQITSTGTCSAGEVTGNDLTANLTAAYVFTTAPSGGRWGFNAGIAAGAVGTPSNTLIDGGLTFVPATTTSAPAAGGGSALPATPAGYMAITVGSTVRQVPYY